MVSADKVPFWFAGFDALDIRRGGFVPGPTGSPSLHMVLATSPRDTALIDKLVLRQLPSRAPASGRSRHGPAASADDARMNEAAASRTILMLFMAFLTVHVSSGAG